MAAVVAAMIGLAVPAAAQRIVCVDPVDPGSLSQRCVAHVPSGATSRTLLVRVEGEVPPDGVVTFTLESPGGAVTRRARLNREKLAQFTWAGTPASAGSSIITAEAEYPDVTVRREIEVRLSPVATNRTLHVLSDTLPHWYASRQLRHPVEVRVDNPGDRCENNLVVFRPMPGSSGLVSPDTVVAEVETTGRGGCIARTWWRLGDVGGRQHLIASLKDEPGKRTTLHAIARVLPRLGGGIVATYDFRNYSVLTSRPTTVQYTRRDTVRISPNQLDTVLVVSDSVIRNREVSSFSDAWFTTPTVNVDFPIDADLRWLRGSLGVSLKDPGRDWYLGVSALQPFLKVNHENLGVDLHLIVHVGRRTIVDDAGCDDDGDLTDCRDREKLFFPMGAGFMGYVSGSELLGKLGGLVF